VEAKYVFIDVESTGLDARKDKLRIVSIDGKAYDVWKQPDADVAAIHLMGAMQDGKTFVAHNAQFDLDFLYQNYPVLEPWQGNIYDTMVASQLITAGRHIPNGLDAVAQRLLGITLDKTFQKADWSRDWIDDQMLEYAANDTKILPDLVRELNAGMREAGVEGIFKLEMALLPALLHAKRVGIKLDVEGAQRLVKLLQEDAGILEAKLPSVALEGHSEAVGEGLFDDASFVQVKQRRLNPRSPQLVAKYFGIPDAEEDTLRDYIQAHPKDEVAKTVRDIRKKYKKISSVKKQLLNRVGEDGRLHPSITQAFTATGRLSAREPNIQQMDQTPDIRSLFVAGVGRKLVIADYSGLELRLVALLSGDKNMIQAFRDGRDMHSETCRLIFGEENKRRRTLSKNINFAYSFGGGHKRLVEAAAKQGVVIDESTAKEYHKAFHDAYPTLSQWQKKVGTSDKEYVHTVQGRRRYIVPKEFYSTRINTPVQGTAADGMKLAMVELYRKGYGAILTVHDELGVECETEMSGMVRDVLVDTMVECMYRASGQDTRNPTVPIAVEVGIGDNWSEA
jgi:DNA polymerase-1